MRREAANNNILSGPKSSVSFRSRPLVCVVSYDLSVVRAAAAKKKKKRTLPIAAGHANLFKLNDKPPNGSRIIRFARPNW